jgi:Ca2+-binding EF-hand superfamily protein
MTQSNCQLPIANCKLQIEQAGSHRRVTLSGGARRLFQFAICNLQFAIYILFLSSSGSEAAAPSRPIRDDVQDLVLFGEKSPVLIRLHLRIDGKPAEAAWGAFMRRLFDYLDVNGDGVLDRKEAERVPSIELIRNGGLPVGGAGKGPTVAELDLNRDGKVTLAVLATWYRMRGLAPFQLQVAVPAANPLGGAAVFSGQRPEPTSDQVSAAIFSLLDTNGDGKLTRQELAAAESVLLRLDQDDDDLISPREIVPNTKRPGLNMFAGMMSKAKKAVPGKQALLTLPRRGEASADLVAACKARYGDRIKAADVVRRVPDLELMLHLGDKGNRPTLSRVPRLGPAFAGGKIAVRDDLALLDLGSVRADLRPGNDEDGYDGFSGIVRQQILALFKSADKDNKGYLTEKDAKGNPLVGGQFKAMDRDGDGKLYEKEVIAYLDQYAELKERAAASCVTLVLSDQGRGLFDLLDANRDGKLSVREVRGAVKLLAELDRQGKGHLTRADVPRLYQLTLRRGLAEPGGISQAQAFKAVYGVPDRGAAERGSTRGPLWFRKMDRNRDGDVSRKEWLFSDELFRAIDADGDGLISVEEAERYEASRAGRK